MEFIETSLFTRIVYDYLSEDEYLGLQVYLLQHPESGKNNPWIRRYQEDPVGLPGER